MVRHVILEGKPTTGKTEISNLFKIFFPDKVIILPELTTVLVRENGLNILQHRRELTDLLAEAVPARAKLIDELTASGEKMVLEESHMGVHWAYSKELEDSYFLELYESKLKALMPIPDKYLRLDMPIQLSIERQRARNTPDVQVDAALITRMFENLDAWHKALGKDNLVVVNTNRSPDLVLADVMKVLELKYEVFAG